MISTAEGEAFTGSVSGPTVWLNQRLSSWEDEGLIDWNTESLTSCLLLCWLRDWVTDWLPALTPTTSLTVWKLTKLSLVCFTGCYGHIYIDIIVTDERESWFLLYIFKPAFISFYSYTPVKFSHSVLQVVMLSYCTVSSLTHTHVHSCRIFQNVLRDSAFLTHTHTKPPSSRWKQ